MDFLGINVDKLLNFNDNSNPLMLLVWIVPIIIFMLYGQRIQLQITSSEINKSLEKLKTFKEDTRKELLDYIKTTIKPTVDPSAKIDKYLGEQVLALDAINFSEGFILHSYEVDEMKLKTLIKNTTISDFQFLDNDQLKQQMSRLKPKGQEGECILPIDHVFNVKGVGTVVLGVIKQGAVKTFDRLKIYQFKCMMIL